MGIIQCSLTITKHALLQYISSLKQHISQLISQWSTACRQWLTVCKDDANGSIGTERAGGEREVVLGGYQSAVAEVQVK